MRTASYIVLSQHIVQYNAFENMILHVYVMMMPAELDSLVPKRAWKGD